MKTIFRKEILILGLSLFMLCGLKGQEDFSMASLDNDYNDIMILLPFDRPTAKNLKTAKEEVSIKKLAFTYDQSVEENFGAYLNPYSLQMKMKLKANVVYKHAQLSNSETGEIIYKSDMSKEDTILDFTDLKKGTYHLILTDDKMNIHSEKITVL